MFCLFPVLAQCCEDFLHQADVVLFSKAKHIDHLNFHVGSVVIACLPAFEVCTENIKPFSALFMDLYFELRESD